MMNDERRNPQKKSNPMKKKQLGPGQYFGPLALVHVAAAPVLQSFAPGCHGKSTRNKG